MDTQINTECPRCNTGYQFKGTNAGKSAKCRTCDNVFAIPDAVSATKAEPILVSNPTLRFNKKWSIGIASAIVLSFVGFIAQKGLLSPDKTFLESKPETAWRMAKGFVAEELKSPSTAVFANEFDEQLALDHAWDIGDRKYFCVGWVDAQNSYGAMLRKKFTCTLREGDDDWWYVEKEVSFYD